MKTKLESVNASTFLFGGLALEKGGWQVKYHATNATDATTGLFDPLTTGIYIAPKNDAEGASNNQRLNLPMFTPSPWTDFVDSTGTGYADFDATVKALNALITTPSNAAVSDLISDKSQVTQGTSKTTTVVANTLNTIITSVSLTDAADTQFAFTFTNSKISATTNVLPTVDMNGGTGWANVAVTRGSGTATVTVRNTGTAAFNSAIKIGLVVI